MLFFIYNWNGLHVCTKIGVNLFFVLNLQAKMRLLKSMAPFLSTSRSTKSLSSREDLGKNDDHVDNKRLSKKIKPPWGSLLGTVAQIG